MGWRLVSFLILVSYPLAFGEMKTYEGKRIKKFEEDARGKDIRPREPEDSPRPKSKGSSQAKRFSGTEMGQKYLRAYSEGLNSYLRDLIKERRKKGQKMTPADRSKIRAKHMGEFEKVQNSMFVIKREKGKKVPGLAQKAPEAPAEPVKPGGATTVDFNKPKR
jgi:hypothetical protein